MAQVCQNKNGGHSFSRVVLSLLTSRNATAIRATAQLKYGKSKTEYFVHDILQTRRREGRRVGRLETREALVSGFERRGGDWTGQRDPRKGIFPPLSREVQKGTWSRPTARPSPKEVRRASQPVASERTPARHRGCRGTRAVEVVAERRKRSKKERKRGERLMR